MLLGLYDHDEYQKIKAEVEEFLGMDMAAAKKYTDALLDQMRVLLREQNKVISISGRMKSFMGVGWKREYRRGV